MDLKRVLSELEALEHRVARLYGWLAEVFSEHDDVRAFFERMRTQELGHANAVHLQSRLLRADPDAFGRLQIDLDPIRELTSRIEEFRSRPDPPSLGEALFFSMQVEVHAAERLRREAALQANADLAGLLQNLARSDEEHFQLLSRFATAHSSSFDGP